MEKNNIYPDMPPNPGDHNPPPSYNQLNSSTASADMMPRMMPSPGTGASWPTQPQQQFNGQPQPIYVQPIQPIQPLGPRSALVTCPSCHQQQMSNIRMESGTKTHLFALLLCLVGCFCCACFPYCMDSCRSINHYCKNCNAYLGTYDK